MVSKQRQRKTDSVPAGDVSAWDVAWQAIVEAKKLKERPAGSKTAREFADALGTSTVHARRVLTDMMEKGQMQSFACLVNGKRGLVYLPVRK